MLGAFGSFRMIWDLSISPADPSCARNTNKLRKRMGIRQMAGSDEFILETHELTKEFAGFFAVCGVALKVRRGSIHALIGPTAPARRRASTC
jgi:hypothetical protein